MKHLNLDSGSGCEMEPHVRPVPGSALSGESASGFSLALCPSLTLKYIIIIEINL